ncbi:hypothetical protein [Endozoicomonas sp. SCSIO W0465]|nr:hypothetical protein [Endozoicomonas sp. SCSIO W0465]
MSDFVSRFDNARIIRRLGEPVSLPDGRVVSGVFEFPANDGALG